MFCTTLDDTRIIRMISLISLCFDEKKRKESNNEGVGGELNGTRVEKNMYLSTTNLWFIPLNALNSPYNFHI